MIIDTEDLAVLVDVKMARSHLAEAIAEFHPVNTCGDYANRSNALAAKGSGLA